MIKWIVILLIVVLTAVCHFGCEEESDEVKVIEYEQINAEQAK